VRPTIFVRRNALTRGVLRSFYQYHQYQDGPQGSETELAVLPVWPLRKLVRW
jgi:hypothetical protein